MLPYIEFGNYSIPAWALFWIVGILAAQVYFQLQGKRLSFRWYISLFAGILLLFTEILGAKILYIIENLEQFRAEGLTFGGFSMFGVFFAVPVLSLLWAKWLRIPYGEFLDYSCGGILLELAFYRVGCFFTGCCGGPPVGVGLLMPDGTRRFPIQLLEAVLDLAILAGILLLCRKKKIPTGTAFCLMLSLYGALRFVLEFFRERDNVFGLLSVSHLLALASCLIGILFIIMTVRKEIHERKIV